PSRMENAPLGPNSRCCPVVSGTSTIGPDGVEREVGMPATMPLPLSMPFQMVGKSAPSCRAALHMSRSARPGSSMLVQIDQLSAPVLDVAQPPLALLS